MALFDKNLNIIGLDENEIFVFGSNKAGRHGMGAARTAMRWGAKYGKGEGMMGQTYALPTKDENLNVLSYHEIELYIDKLCKAARLLPGLTFLLTAVGTGLAGLSEARIKQILGKCSPPPNVIPWYAFQRYNEACNTVSLW
jgi:hypothetical protein